MLLHISQNQLIFPITFRHSYFKASRLYSPTALIHLIRGLEMAQYYQPPSQPAYSSQNLQFFPSSYAAPVSGHSTPAQAQYGSYGSSSTQQSNAAYGGFMSSPGFGAPPQGVSGRMGEQGGLRTGWLAAFGTEGYEGEPPLLEELGVNFGHIKTKVGGF